MSAAAQRKAWAGKDRTVTDFKREGPGAPNIVDHATFQAELEELRVREKAHTREGDAIAAPRRRLPMVEVDATTSLTGPDGPSSLLEARPPGWLGGRTSATLMAMAAALLFAFLIIESSEI